MSAATRLALGGATFGLDYGVSNSKGRLTRDELGRLLALAWEAGVDMVDLAPAYGGAEAAFSEARPETAMFRVVSKTIRADQSLDAVAAAARRSAAAAPGGGALDALLVHAAADLAGPGGDALWALLRGLKADGVARRIGISAYVADDPAALAERFGPDVMQIPLSFLDQRLLRSGALGRLKQLGVEIHARSAFLQGLVFLPPDRLPASIARIGPRLAEIHTEIAAAEMSPLTAALGFVLGRPEIDRVVLGAASAGEFAQSLRAADAPMRDLDWPRLALDDEHALTPSLW